MAQSLSAIWRDPSNATEVVNRTSFKPKDLLGETFSLVSVKNQNGWVTFQVKYQGQVKPLEFDCRPNRDGKHSSTASHRLSMASLVEEHKGLDGVTMYLEPAKGQYGKDSYRFAPANGS